MEKKVNSQGHPASCRNCISWGKMEKFKRDSQNKKERITIIYGTCFNPATKLEFIHNGEKSCCIMTPANAICPNFKWRNE